MTMISAAPPSSILLLAPIARHVRRGSNAAPGGHDHPSIVGSVTETQGWADDTANQRGPIPDCWGPAPPSPTHMPSPSGHTQYVYRNGVIAH